VARQLIELEVSFEEAYSDDLKHIAYSVRKMFKKSVLIQRVGWVAQSV
jgi:hypothetical protein